MSARHSTARPASRHGDFIRIRGARVHNLKNLSVDIPKNQLVVITGLSGSGKSSLAFDTIFAEGQRRYVASLSSYASQILDVQDKPDVDAIDGLSPTIAIDQHAGTRNPRSTVGTATDIYDFLRLLFARIGRPHCHLCGSPVVEQSAAEIAKKILALTAETDLQIFVPVIAGQKGEHKYTLLSAQRAGFKRVRFDGVVLDIDEALSMPKDKNRPHTIDLLLREISREEEINFPAFLPTVKKGLNLGNGLLFVWREDSGEGILYSRHFSCPQCQIALPTPEPRLFSFNSPSGACPECTGLGIKLVLEPELVIPNPRLTLAEGAVRPWTKVAGNHGAPLRLLEAVGQRHNFDLQTPIERLPPKVLSLILNGTGDEHYLVAGVGQTFPGVLKMLETKYRQTDSEYVHKELESCMRTLVCPICRGQRLRPEVLAIKVVDRSIAEVVALPIERFAYFAAEIASADNLTADERLIAERVLAEIKGRLTNLLDVGLGYLTLDRAMMTLSGGEAQRVRLSSQLASGLTGVIYILDEPTIGLHPCDSQRLIAIIRRLRDLGNSVIIVEHDRIMIEEADHLIDIGPGAGVGGGELVAQGRPSQIRRMAESLTGAYLSGKKKIPVPKKRRQGNGKVLKIIGAQVFNLRNIDVEIPLGEFVCVTGVSGSGKSSLILDILGRALAKHFYRAKAEPGEHRAIRGLSALDKVVTVDQTPIGRTPRSNPATYTGLFTAIRDLYTQTPEAKIRGFDAGRFSFNVRGGGRCEVCAGEGQRQIEMQFLPDVYVECQECHGRRYNAETLEIFYKGKNIADVLAMTVDEARRFFSDQSAVHEKLNVLSEVGLGYLRLGQSATTLSGGEAQRVKLSSELSRRANGKTIYILDEPTTGLHFEDIHRLLGVLQALVDRGNTVLVIEHNLDVIKCADWVIDLGPGGGEAGGEIVATGEPEKIAKTKKSVTGQYLKGLI